MFAILIIIVLLVLIIFILARFFAIKKQLKAILEQLHMYHTRQTDKKITVSLFDQTIENLGEEINQLIDLHVMEQQKRINFESEYKRMIANISHDLRTPLTSILGYIQMAQQENVSQREKNELLSIAHERAQRLESLLTDFFELSIIESQDYQLTADPINLNKFIINILMSFYDRFQVLNKEPTIHLPEKNIHIVGDRSAITRILENLITNALTHGDGEIEISLIQQHEQVKLVVKNAAPHLTPEDVQLMFDRFYIADKSRTGRSTGLGLAIVKSLMQKMNGEIFANLDEDVLSIICSWKVSPQHIKTKINQSPS